MGSSGLNVWGELSVDSSKKLGFRNMIAKNGYHTSETNKGGVFYCPLFFWFCCCNGCALPLVALQYHDVDVHIELRKFDEIYLTSDGVKPTVKPSITDVNLCVSYVILDTDEKRKFAQSSHEYLIRQVQINEAKNVTMPDSGYLNYNFPLFYNHPVIELIFTIQRTDIGDIGPELGNNWSNYGRFLSNVSTDPEETGPLENAKIMMNSQDYTDTWDNVLKHAKLLEKKFKNKKK